MSGGDVFAIVFWGVFVAIVAVYVVRARRKSTRSLGAESAEDRRQRLLREYEGRSRDGGRRRLWDVRGDDHGRGGGCSGGAGCSGSSCGGGGGN